VYVGSLDSTDVTRLPISSLAAFAPPGWLLYLRDSTIVAHAFNPDTLELSGEPIPVANDIGAIGNTGGVFSVSETGVLAYRRALPPAPTELTWFDRQGKPLGKVSGPAMYSNPALSPDGSRLAVGRDDPATGTRDIWIIDLTRGGMGSRFTFDKADDLNPVWSPDGARVAFTSNRRGIRDLFWRTSGGMGGDELLLEDKESKSLEDWSPDGQTLVFNVASREIFGLSLGDRKSFPIVQTQFANAQGRLSPDGRWIAYTSDESGRAEIFVQSFPPTGAKFQISTMGGVEAQWRGDGRELFFLSGTKLFVADVQATGSSFEAGAPRQLFDVPAVTGVLRRNRYLVTRDGQRFLVVTTEQKTDSTPFTVVLNWQAALPQK
jgi:dipeptidyl aminopeptidase/acylaminoacyl peptidase